jgi:hypothetical protein
MATEPEIPIRIIVEHAPVGVTFAVQLGRSELLAPTMSGTNLVFEFQLRLKRGATGQTVFLGPAAQGPPRDRFVYVNSGTMAGQPSSCWTRRAKIKLAGIDRALVERVLARRGSRLEARIAGVGRDGGPACATVPLLSGAWKIAE